MTCHHYQTQMKQTMNRNICKGNEGVKHKIKFEGQNNEIIKWNVLLEQSRLKNEGLKLSSAFLKDLKTAVH